MINKMWLAGFIDGEGCFNITRIKKNIFPRLLIANTNLDILEEIRKQYGGDINSRRNGPDHWKTFNLYRASWNSLRKILKDVFPYLRLKKRQAKICLKMLETKDKNIRINMREEVRKLNKKGI